jgi:hypothetical protein
LIINLLDEIEDLFIRCEGIGIGFNVHQIGGQIFVNLEIESKILDLILSMIQAIKYALYYVGYCQLDFPLGACDSLWAIFVRRLGYQIPEIINGHKIIIVD